MADNMYTKESLEHLNASKESGKFNKTFNPNLIWGIIGTVVLVAGALVWGFFGNVQTSISVVGIDMHIDNNIVDLFISEDDISSVKVGQEVIINNNSCKIDTITAYPLQIVEDEDALYGNEDENMWNVYQNYILYYSGEESGSWFYMAEAEYHGEAPSYRFFTCEVVTESMSPIAKFFKGGLK